MKRKNIILHEGEKSLASHISSILTEEGYPVFCRENFCEDEDAADPHIVIIDIDHSDIPYRDLARMYRNIHYQTPLQIVYIGGSKDTLLVALEKDGGDDFIHLPAEDLDFTARIKAADIRLANQYHLIQEREFFRNAVKQEEELSARILDQHVSLKEAFKNIEKFNQELATSNRRLEEIAKHDMLSGLLNRMSLFHAIDVEIDRAMRTPSPLCGIMIDIDFFKDINDNFGHPVGDKVIKQIGLRLRQLLRTYDHAGRYGGEEFFILLPNTTLDQAHIIGERFRSDLELKPIIIDEGTMHVTASLGVSSYREGESREGWIYRTDKAMYQAKQLGRNRVVSG
ncbi:MAG: diguanylate cyclase [Spirochaetales bacterium]|nr:diguanylate cyclase [Spirochaetales bacterium]